MVCWAGRGHPQTSRAAFFRTQHLWVRKKGKAGRPDGCEAIERDLPCPVMPYQANKGWPPT